MCMSVRIHWVYNNTNVCVCVCVCLDLYRGRREIVECINVFSETLRTSGQERDTEGGGAWWVSGNGGQLCQHGILQVSVSVCER